MKSSHQPRPRHANRDNQRDKLAELVKGALLADTPPPMPDDASTTSPATSSSATLILQLLPGHGVPTWRATLVVVRLAAGLPSVVLQVVPQVAQLLHLAHLHAPCTMHHARSEIWAQGTCPPTCVVSDTYTCLRPCLSWITCMRAVGEVDIEFML